MSVITKAIAGFFLFVALLFPKLSYALVVSPLVTDVMIDPGSEKTISIAIGSDLQASTVELSLARVRFGEEYSDLEFLPIDDLASWVTLSERTFAMAESGVKTIEVTIDVPPSVGPASSPFAVLVRETPREGGVAVATSIAALVFLTVDQEHLATNVELKACSIDARQDGGYDLEMSIANHGQGILQPSGTIHVRNMFGIPIEEHGVSLFGRTPVGTTRSYAWSINDSSTVFGRMWNDLRRLRIGRLEYSCEIDGATPIVGYTWVVPRGMLMTGAAVFGAGAIAYILRRRRTSK